MSRRLLLLLIGTHTLLALAAGGSAAQSAAPASPVTLTMAGWPRGRLRSHRLVGLGSTYVTWFNLRQLTDVSRCNLQQHLSCNKRRALHYLPGPSREQPRRASPLRGCSNPAVRIPMNTMTPTRPAELHACRGRGRQP